MLQAYVPDPRGSDSGVTVASGFDLGARNTHDLSRLGIKVELLNKLKPYLGLKGLNALEKIKHNPLNISTTDCAFIDNALKTHFISSFSLKYNQAITSKSLKFQELPWQAQTVMISVAFQYGNLCTETPQFWEALTAQDWVKTISILEDFKDKYKPRRLREAALLKEAFK